MWQTENKKTLKLIKHSRTRESIYPSISWLRKLRLVTCI